MSTDAINLARMDPGADLMPDELIRRCTEHVLRTLGGKALRYAAREGLPRLRGLIAEDLARQGVPAAAEDIVVTSGSQQGIDLRGARPAQPGRALPGRRFDLRRRAQRVHRRRRAAERGARR